MFAFAIDKTEQAMTNAKNPPPVPPAGRSDKGPPGAKEKHPPTAAATGKAAPSDPEHRGQQANIQQTPPIPACSRTGDMASKDHETDRAHGGPGSSHQDARDPKSATRRGPEPGQPTNPPRSRVSGGGGERDIHHAHDPRVKS